MTERDIIRDVEDDKNDDDAFFEEVSIEEQLSSKSTPQSKVLLQFIRNFQYLAPNLCYILISILSVPSVTAGLERFFSTLNESNRKHVIDFLLNV